MTAEITSIKNVFHSSIIQQCKIYPWEKESHTIITYWLCKNDTIQIYKVINSKPVLMKEVNKVFQNYSHEVTDVKISGLKMFESLDKIVVFGRDAFSILPLSKILNSTDLKIESKDIGAIVTSCTYWITDIEITLEKCYILTCYNELLIYDIETFKLLNRVKQNKVNSISYKGYLRMNNEELIVVSPSVLNGCLVWKYKTNNDEVIDLYKLADDSHHGIIFDACIDNEYKYLLTCSDDRSINLYDFQTGKLLQKLYGHVSRVWKVKFVYNSGDTDLWGILSCSEDCKFITWKFDEDKTTLSKHNAHEVNHIKNCWNIDYYDNQVLSCGNDGRVKLTFIDIDDKSTANIIPLELSKKEMIKDMIRIADNDYVLLSNNGNMLYNINTKNTEEPAIDSIAVESVFKIIDIEYNNMFLTLDKKNYMTLYQKTSKVKKIKVLMITDVSKILSLSLVGKVDANHFEFVVDSPNKNDKFMLYSFNLEKLVITKVHEYSKVVSHQKQPMTVTCGAYTKTNDSLLIGTLNGKLIHYNGAELITYKSYSENNDAVVVISTTPFKSEQDKDLLLVFSRSQYSLVSTDLKTEVLNNISSSKIESIKYSSDNGIIITTNKDGCFIQFNESKNMIVNQYKLKNDIKASFTGKENWFAYVFLKDNKSYINIETIREKRDLLIHEGTHGRETRCITILDETDDVINFVTGSEDTTVKLHTFDKSNDLSGNSQSMTYRGHVSGLQTSGKIQLKSGKQLFLSTSAKEELFIWSYNKVKDIKRNNMKSYLNLETKLPTTRDLKRGKGIVNNVELRVTCFCFDTNNNVLYTCYSNSMIRSWDFTFDETTNEYNITLKNEVFYKQCSIFDCTLINDYLLLGTSEGILVSYKINGSKLEMKDCLNAHQNGIMSIDRVRDDYLITGGDDNAISLVKIDNSTGIFEIINQITNVSNSAITNVKKVTDDSFLFTSIDQLVGTYSIDYDKKSMKEIKKFYTNIADTQSVDITEDFVFLGGLGLSIYRDLI